MKKHLHFVNIAILFSAAASTFLNSCGSDDTKEDPKSEDPIVGTWKLTEASLADGTQILGTIYLESPCAADDVFIFEHNMVSDTSGDLSVDIGITDCYETPPTSDIVEGGTWLYKNNKTQLTITLPQEAGFPIPVIDLKNIGFPNDNTLTGVIDGLVGLESEIEITLTRQP